MTLSLYKPVHMTLSLQTGAHDTAHCLFVFLSPGNRSTLAEFSASKNKILWWFLDAGEDVVSRS
jgi:hypothetical protein